MKRVDGDFKARVYDLVTRIPKGRVMTYGQVAALCGAPWAAWEVGQIAHYGPEALPWHRVVNKQGSLARAYTWGGLEGHRRALTSEGIAVSPEFKVDVAVLQWLPGES